MENKKKRILSPKNQRGEKIMKQPLFKMFMNDSNRKLHLLKHNISNSKDSSLSNPIEESNKKKIHHKNMHLNLQLFSYKILEAKHNSTPELYLKRTLNNLIKRKKCHYVADFNERILSMSQLRDFLKRYYTIEETKERIPKYVSYYKNYLTFFCRPIFVSYITNKKMVRHMEKVAQVFYNENYAEEEKDDKEKSKKKEKNIVIFNKKIKKEIEDGDIYTVVTSEAAMKQIQKMNNKVNKEIMDNPNSNNEKNVIENNINPIKIDEISIYDNNYKITPIKGIDGNIEINTNEIISDLKNKDIIPQTTNSINLLIEELQSKEIKSDSNNIKPENNKEIIKNMHNNCIVIKGGKTTNNINININHLTISRKASSKKDDEPNIISNENKNNNPKNKYIKKFKNSNTNTKERNNNQKSTNENKNELNTDKEKEKDKDKDKEKHKTKTFTLTLPPPSHNSLSRTNSVVNKNFNQIFPKTINNNNNIKQNIEIKSPSLLKNGYNGTVTSLHKYISFGKGNSSQNQIAKKTLYTNYSNRLSNIFKNMNYGTSKASKNINIVYTKNVGILSGERTRSISSMKNRQKRIIYSSLHFNGSNLHLLNLKNNIGTSKNSEHRSSSTDKRFAEFKMKKDKIPLIKYKEEESKTSKKGLKVKAKHLNLQKLLNVFPKKSNKTRVTDNLIY
jgi:hypothetical protein